MCSEFRTPRSSEIVQDALGTSLTDKSGDFEWGKTTKMFTSSPVIHKVNGKLELVQKVFPSSPMPNARLSGIGNQSDGSDKEDDSDAQIKRIYEMPRHIADDVKRARTAKLEYAGAANERLAESLREGGTGNPNINSDRISDSEIQIRRIYEVPRWKEAFKSSPVLIPMAGFSEFAYWGEEAGTAQEFKIPKEEVMFAAGITMKPFKPTGTKDDGFAILTHTATLQMLDYHHRLVVLLKAKQAKEYLETMTPEERFDFLLENRFTGKLEVHKIRNMAAAWKGRVAAQVAKKLREDHYRQILKKEGVAG